MNTVAIIGARSGSKGLPGKNIRGLAGHPLIAYSIRAALLATNIDRVIVSTDSEEYAQFAQSYGADIIKQPLDTAGDFSGDYPFIAHAIDCMRVHYETMPDLLVHLRPTTPLRDPGRIENAIATLAVNKGATALRSVHEMPESAYKSFEIHGGCLKMVGTGSFALDDANLPRQRYPKTYHPNGYVDVLRTEFIRSKQFLGTRILHGDRVIPFVTPHVTEVDTEEDFAMLKYEVLTKPEVVKRLFP